MKVLAEKKCLGEINSLETGWEERGYRKWQRAGHKTRGGKFNWVRVTSAGKSYQKAGLKKQTSYNSLFFLQDLIILAKGSQEDERGDVFKTVNPFPTFWLLTSNVNNPVVKQGIGFPLSI